MFSICSGLVLSSWIYTFPNNHHSNSLLYQTVNICSSEEIFHSFFRKQILKTEFSKTVVSISPLHSNHLQQPPFIVLATGTVSKLSYFSNYMLREKRFRALIGISFQKQVCFGLPKLYVLLKKTVLPPASFSKWYSHLITFWLSFVR